MKKGRPPSGKPRRIKTGISFTPPHFTWLRNRGDTAGLVEEALNRFIPPEELVEIEEQIKQQSDGR